MRLNRIGASALLVLIGGVMHPINDYAKIDGERRRYLAAGETEIRKWVFYLSDDPFLPLTFTGREFVLMMSRD